MSLNLRPRRRPVPTIPIVSLIDIMVVLLIFVVATTTFKKNQTRMEIALPSSKSLGATTSAPDVRVTLGITKTNEIFIDATPVKIENLAQALKDLRTNQPNSKLELEADTATALGTLVQVWDALKEAGIPVTDVPARIQRAGS
ncbi:MAG: Biopolymer transport protein ExbD/TolR [Verrucomicrobiaceae bacterium]|nr:Biopolymer transport protein ExbD/TolR [Verrucomicrobiaceae bacterium]